jgi:hypothetical protein
MDVEELTQTCTRCRRTRREKFLIERKNRAGKRVWRCRKRSVCATKSRRRLIMIAKAKESV